MDSDLLSVEVRVISAQKLKDAKRWSPFGCMSPFAEVWVSSNAPKQYTKIHCSGGRNPVWNSEVLQLSCTRTGFFKQSVNLTIDVYHRGSIFDRSLGEVKVPLTFQYYGEKEVIVKQRLLLRNGKEQGNIKFSIKISKMHTPEVIMSPDSIVSPEYIFDKVVERPIPFSGRLYPHIVKRYSIDATRSIDASRSHSFPSRTYYT